MSILLGGVCVSGKDSTPLVAEFHVPSAGPVHAQ